MEGDRLKELVAKVAKEELREDENTRRQSLEQFRDWILKNPDIKGCRTDDSFLLRFLRTKKFSVPMAEQLLTNFISFRQNYKDVLSKLDILDPDIDEIISGGLVFVSPVRDDSGRSVIFISFRNFDYKKYDWKKMFRAFQLNFHCIMEDEDTQVVGLTYVLDFEDSTPFYTIFPFRDLYNICTHHEKSLPMRTRDVNAFNLSPTALRFYNLLQSFQAEKIQRRYKVLDSVDDLKKKLNPRTLPKEYGGTMPMAEMISRWKAVLMSHRENILLLDQTSVEGDSFKILKNVGDDDLPGSFRKLEMD